MSLNILRTLSRTSLGVSFAYKILATGIFAYYLIREVAKDHGRETSGDGGDVVRFPGGGGYSPS